MSGRDVKQASQVCLPSCQVYRCDDSMTSHRRMIRNSCEMESLHATAVNQSPSAIFFVKNTHSTPYIVYGAAQDPTLEPTRLRTMTFCNHSCHSRTRDTILPDPEYWRSFDFNGIHSSPIPLCRRRVLSCFNRSPPKSFRLL